MLTIHSSSMLLLCGIISIDVLYIYIYYIGKQISPKMVCCIIKCDNVENHTGARVVLNAVYGCNSPPKPVFRWSNNHRNLFLFPIYCMTGSIWDKVYRLKSQKSWIWKEYTQRRHCNINTSATVSIFDQNLRMGELIWGFMVVTYLMLSH